MYVCVSVSVSVCLCVHSCMYNSRMYNDCLCVIFLTDDANTLPQKLRIAINTFRLNHA